MLASMTSRQYTEWRAFFEHEHLGGVEERADLRMGIAVAAAVNMHRASGQSKVKPADVMPKFGTDEAPEDIYTSLGRVAQRSPARRPRRAGAETSGAPDVSD